MKLEGNAWIDLFRVELLSTGVTASLLQTLLFKVNRRLKQQPVNDDDGERNYCCVHLAIGAANLQLVATNVDSEVTAVADFSAVVAIVSLSPSACSWLFVHYSSVTTSCGHLATAIDPAMP